MSAAFSGDLLAEVLERVGVDDVIGSMSTPHEIDTDSVHQKHGSSQAPAHACHWLSIHFVEGSTCFNGWQHLVGRRM